MPWFARGTCTLCYQHVCPGQTAGMAATVITVGYELFMRQRFVVQPAQEAFQLGLPLQAPTGCTAVSAAVQDRHCSPCHLCNPAAGQHELVCLHVPALPALCMQH